MTVDHIKLAASLRGHRFRFTSERELHDGIALCLESLGVNYSYERSINSKDRPDFMVGPDPAVAIEAKVGGSLAELTRQVHRYATSPKVRAIVVVSSKARHRNMPPTIQGKPVVVVHLVAV